MFYGWIILLIICVNYIVLSCGALYSYGTILVPMAAELGLTMTQAAMAQTVKTLLTSLFALGIGQFVLKRVKITTVILCGCLAGSLLGLLMAFFVRDRLSYYLCYPILVSLMNSCGGLFTSQVLLTKWFETRRSTAVSIMLSMGGVGGVIFPQIASAMLNSFSWRSIWMLLAGLSMACVVITRLFLKETPQEMGLIPDGVPKEGRKAAAVPSYRTRVSFTQKETLLTPFFYVCVLTHVATSNGVTSTGNYLVSHLMNNGLDRAVGATAVSIFAFFNIFGRSLSGVIQDRVNPRTIMKVLLPIMVVALFFVPGLDSAPKAWIFASVYGLCLSIAVPCPVGILMNSFGVEHYGKISSVENGMCNVMNACLALIPGLIYDGTGSYNWYYRFIGIYMFAMLVLQLAFKTPVKEESAPGSQPA